MRNRHATTNFSLAATDNVRSDLPVWVWMLAFICLSLSTSRASDPNSDLDTNHPTAKPARAGVTSQSLTAKDQSVKVMSNVSADIRVITNNFEQPPPTFTVVRSPKHGSLQYDSGDYCIFTPADRFAGRDSFTYKVNYGGLDSRVATVRIYVDGSELNHAPKAYSFFASVLQDEKTDVYLSASDREDDELRYTILKKPIHGSLSGKNKAISYTPVHGYVGEDLFTYKVNDGKLDSNVAKATLDVGPSDYDPSLAVPENVHGEPGKKQAGKTQSEH